jgi:hypothetical protein
MRFGGCQRSTGFFLANDTFLDGNIESYAVNGNWVTGFTSAKCLDKEGRAICEGYYLLNTLSHNSMEGMSLQEWEQALKEIGWKSPNLIKLKKTR